MMPENSEECGFVMLQKSVAKVKTIALSYATATHFITFQAKNAKIAPSRF
jgi:hypothetical protein